MNLFDRVMLRDIPFTGSLFGDWYAPRYLQWMIVASAVAIGFALLAFIIDRILKARGFK